MGLKIAASECKALQKTRDHRILKSNSNLLVDAISQLNGGVVSQNNEDGVVRMKIVLKKRDLKQILKAMEVREHFTARQPPFSVMCAEQRLNLLRRRHLLGINAAEKGSPLRPTWCPALQSIPEGL